MNPFRRSLRPLLVVLVLGASAAAYVRARAPEWARRLIEERLTRFFQRPSQVASVRLRLLPLEVEISGLRVQGRTGASPPFLEVPKVLATATWHWPLGPSAIELSRVRVERPVVRVNAFEGGGDDLPRLGGGGGGLHLRVARLTVVEGEAWVDHRRVPLDLDVPHLTARLEGRAHGGLEGPVSLGPGAVRFGDAEPLALESRLHLVVVGSELRATRGVLKAEGTELHYDGALRLVPRPLGTFALRGPVDLAVVDRHVARTGFSLAGDARYDGSVSVDGSRLRFRGRLSGTAGSFDGVPVPRYDGEIRWDETGVHLAGFLVHALSGEARLDVDVPPRPGEARVRGTVDGMDAEGLSRLVFGWDAAGLAAATRGPLDLRWPRGRTREITGTASLDFTPRADGRTPLQGRLAWSAEGGRQTVEAAEFETPMARARAHGTIEADDRTELALETESGDLAQADALLARLRRALGTAEAVPAAVGGRGTFRGRWRGTIAEPVFEGHFTGDEVSYLGVRWGAADWRGQLDARRVVSETLVLRRPGGELRLSGPAESGPYGGEDALDVHVVFHDWPARDLLQAVGSEMPLSALLSGTARVRGRRSAPTGDLQVRADEGRYAGILFRRLDVDSRLRPRHVEVVRGRAEVGGGSLTFHGSVTDDGLYDGRAELSSVELEEAFPRVPEALRPAGRLSGALTLQGPLARPRVVGELSAPRLFVGEEGLGALRASLVGTGDGRVQVEASCRSARVDLVLGGEVAAARPFEAALRVVAKETSLDPYLRLAWTALPAAVGVVATGDLRLEGPLSTPSALRGEGTFAALDVRFPEYPVRNPRPVKIALGGGAVELRELALAGEGTDLALSGRLALAADGPLEMAARGAADLRALSAVARGLRARGSARLSLQVTGTRALPRVTGRLDVDGGGLRLRGFPHGLDDVKGGLRFTETAAQLVGVTGTVGGGRVEMEGQLGYAAGRPLTVDVAARGQGIALRYPEGLRSVIDGDVRLTGDAKAPWATGQLEVRQALWTRRYDVATELLAARAAWSADAPGLDEGVRLDLKVRAPGTIRVDNNLATLQARADLSVQGTLEAPVILGRAEIERGRVYFQGNTYLIRRGTLDFANPQRLDPLFDVEAETRLRAYRITLRVNGTLDRVVPTLTSDPPLTTLEVLSLLAGSSEPHGSPADTGQRLAVTGAAALVAGAVTGAATERIGLEQRLGLSRFSIDPSVFKGTQTDLSARVTLGKRITPDLSVLYSQELRGPEERIVSVEYTLSDRLSLLLTRAEATGAAFDVRFRQTR